MIAQALIAAGLLAGSVTPAAASVADQTYEVPTTISADCSVEVSAEINAWIASVPDDSELILGEDACYRVEKRIYVTDRHNLTFVGQGSTFYNTLVPPGARWTRPIWHVTGGSGISFGDMIVRGTNPTHVFKVDYEWWALFRFDGVTGVSLDEITGQNAWGDLITLGPDTRTQPATPTSEVILQRSTGSIIGRNVVSCTACHDVLIADNAFTGIGYQVFDVEVESRDWSASDVTFRDNVIGNHHLSVLVDGGIGDHVDDVTFTGNVMTEASETCESPVYVLDGPGTKSGYVITGNVLRSHSPIFRLSGVDGLVARDNQGIFVGGIQCQYQGGAIRAQNSTITVERNDLGGYGFLLKIEGDPALMSMTACGNRLKDDPLYDEPVSCG